MSFKNFLDLRKKSQPQIQIIEKIVFQKRSIKSDLFLILTVIFVASGIMWGISKADNIPQPPKSITNNFSAYGIVSENLGNSLTIITAKGSDDPSRTEYTFNTNTVKIIETKSYAPLNISDIKPGFKIIVQGTGAGDGVVLDRIISFGMFMVMPEKVATTTPEIATSTLDVQAATSTLENADIGTGTEATSTTDGQANPISDIVDHVIDAVTNVIDNVVDAIVGTSTDTTVGTSADSNNSENISGTSTDSQTETNTGLGSSGVSEDDNAGTSTTTTPGTSTTSDASSENSESTTTDQTIFETVTNTITDAVNSVVDSITNTVGNVVDVITGTDQNSGLGSPLSTARMTMRE
jgi:hypothetical protein